MSKFKLCLDCKHCKAVMEHYENVPQAFSTSLEFYCSKNNNKYLGSMVNKKGETEFLPCFEKREEIK